MILLSEINICWFKAATKKTIFCLCMVHHIWSITTQNFNQLKVYKEIAANNLDK